MGIDLNNVIWRPYQKECKKSIKDNYDQGITRQLIVSATGTGKRIMAVDIMRHFQRSLFVAHREELIMQAYDEIEKFWPMHAGIIKGSLFEIDKRIVVASVQTLVNRLDKMDPNMFDFVVIDECFPAGTKVDGKNIEDYSIGDSITSFNHKTSKTEKSIVTKVMQREYSGKMYDFGQFQCTPNHPIFIVGIGYCLAKEIYYAYLCYKVMYYGSKSLSYLQKLWKRVFNKNWTMDLFNRMRNNKKKSQQNRRHTSYLQKLWNNSNHRGAEQQKTLHALSTKRILLLFSKMQKGIFWENSIYNNGNNKSKILFGENEEEQSNVKSRDSSKSKTQNARTDFSKQRRKRRAYETAIINSSIDQSSNGMRYICEEPNVTREMSSEELQSGSGMSGSKISNRNRWEDSPIKALEVLRQTEDGHFEKSWLDYIKIYKQGSRSESTKGCKENYVYNLEVKGNNNYFANSILVHNCHHYMSPTYLRVARHFQPKLMTAWTATPKRLDGLSLVNIVDKIVFQYNIRDGITDGYLAPIEAYQVRTQSDLSRVKRTAGDFNQQQLSEEVDTELRNTLAAAKYKQYAEGKQAIAFCVDIDHAYHVRDKFREEGISCEVIVSDTNKCPNRTELFAGFANKEFDVLANVNIATEGYDYNDIGCILMLRPTQSETLYTQCIGRGTRLKSIEFINKNGNDKCIVLDFVDNTGKLALINAYELEKNMEIEDRVFLPEEYKLKLIEEREKKKRMHVFSSGVDSHVDILNLPTVTAWDSAKMLEPATEKQIKWMRETGVWQPDVEYTKKQASELISSLPCQSWQLVWLANMKYDVSRGATIGQYQRVKSMLAQRDKYKVPQADVNKLLRNMNS